MRPGPRTAFIVAGVSAALAAPDAAFAAAARAADWARPLVLAQAPSKDDANEQRRKQQQQKQQQQHKQQEQKQQQQQQQRGQQQQQQQQRGQQQQQQQQQRGQQQQQQQQQRGQQQQQQQPGQQQGQTPSSAKPTQPAQTPQPPKAPQPAQVPQTTPPQAPQTTSPQQPQKPQQPTVAPTTTQPAQTPQQPSGIQRVQPTPQPVQPTQQPAAVPQRVPAQPGTAPSAVTTTRPGFERGGPRNMDELRGQRRQHDEGGRRVIEEPDRRTIVRDKDRLIIRHDETSRFQRFGSDARVERQGNDYRNIVNRPGGVQIITVTDANGRLLRRIRRGPDGREVILIDNRLRGAAVVGAVGAAALATAYFLTLPPPHISIPHEQYIVGYGNAPPPDIYAALAAPPLEPPERAYALDEIRYNYNLRARMRRVVINTINFDSGSWELRQDQIGQLEHIANAIRQLISRNQNEVVLISGHTDATGSDEDNLSLSDRRAETIAAVLTEQFQIPPENLVTQGYGEQHLLIPNQGPEPGNRRAEVIRITPLLAGR